MIIKKLLQLTCPEITEAQYKKLNDRMHRLIEHPQSREEIKPPTFKIPISQEAQKYYSKGRKATPTITTNIEPYLEALGLELATTFDVKNVNSANRVPASPKRIVGDILLRDVEQACTQTNAQNTWLARGLNGDEYGLIVGQKQPKPGDIQTCIKNVYALFEHNGQITFEKAHITPTNQLPKPINLPEYTGNQQERQKRLAIFSDNCASLIKIINEIKNPDQQKRLLQLVEQLSYDTLIEAISRKQGIENLVYPCQSYEQIFNIMRRQGQNVFYVIRIEIKNVLKRINDQSKSYKIGDDIILQEIEPILREMTNKFGVIYVVRRGLSYLIGTHTEANDATCKDLSTTLSGLRNTGIGNQKIPFIYGIGATEVNLDEISSGNKAEAYATFDLGVSQAYNKAKLNNQQTTKRFYTQTDSKDAWEHFFYEYNPNTEKGIANLVQLGVRNEIIYEYKEQFNATSPEDNSNLIAFTKRKVLE